MNFITKLAKIAKKNNSLVCIGLDSEFEKLPDFLKNEKHPQFVFNRAIIEATAEMVCCYKPNLAFYQEQGLAGLLQLKFTIKYLQDKYPAIPVILDAKLADIGNTNQGYVKFIFDFYGADAVTAHPYLGKEALTPFLDRKDKGIFVLCKTSNPGAGEFQDLLIDTAGVAPLNGDFPDGGRIKKPLFQIIAENVSKDWNYNGNCGLVVGATYPSELNIVRHIVGDMPLLIPGFGSQGGNIEKAVKAGVDRHGQNAIINSSRAIIFASSGHDFAKKAKSETIKLRDEINKYR